MDRERRERQKSIRAARAWLTGAEDALAGEDDLAGDLKLMLARAELARIAAHRRARLRRWAGWLVPPIAAAAVWAWIAWESPSPQEETAQPFPVRAAQERAEMPAPEMVAAAPAPPPVEPSAAETGEPSAASSSSTQAPETAVAAPAALRNEPEQPARSKAAARMPNADMQRLMQVGGKILRE